MAVTKTGGTSQPKWLLLRLCHVRASMPGFTWKPDPAAATGSSCSHGARRRKWGLRSNGKGTALWTQPKSETGREVQSEAEKATIGKKMGNHSLVCIISPLLPPGLTGRDTTRDDKISCYYTDSPSRPSLSCQLPTSVDSNVNKALPELMLVGGRGDHRARGCAGGARRM